MKAAAVIQRSRLLNSTEVIDMWIMIVMSSYLGNHISYDGTTATPISITPSLIFFKVFHELIVIFPIFMYIILSEFFH